MDKLSFDLIKETLKQKRHDYMNDIQLVYGYLMMNKNEKAIEKIENIIKKNKVEGQLSKIQSHMLHKSLEKFIKTIFSRGRDLDLYIYESEGEICTREEDLLEIEKLLEILAKGIDCGVCIFTEEINSSFSVKLLLEDPGAISGLECLIEQGGCDLNKILIEDDYILYDADLE